MTVAFSTSGEGRGIQSLDHLTVERRSWNMRQIRSKNTKPELLVRSILHSMGYRFRLNGKISKKVCRKGFLPGKPDIVLAKYKTVIFINGCFWHRHENCKKSNIPKSNTEYWERKLNNNVKRDLNNIKLLSQLGWRSIILWECEIKDLEILKYKIKGNLNE